ncbi:unnamed protein product, partial [Amoebophrya sp. A25]
FLKDKTVKEIRRRVLHKIDSPSHETPENFFYTLPELDGRFSFYENPLKWPAMENKLTLVGAQAGATKFSTKMLETNTAVAELFTNWYLS